VPEQTFRHSLWTCQALERYWRPTQPPRTNSQMLQSVVVVDVVKT